jgi:hypothetical protein
VHVGGKSTSEGVFHTAIQDSSGNWFIIENEIVCTLLSLWLRCADTLGQTNSAEKTEKTRSLHVVLFATINLESRALE